MSQRTDIDTVPGEPQLERWQGGGRIAGIAVFIVLITAAVLALPGLGELRERLAGADPALIALALLLELASCVAFVAAFRGVFSRRLSWRFSLEVGMAEQAANVLLPTGGAGGLARISGVSQPHIHNVLKGKRIFSQEMSDEILLHLRIDLLDLLTAEDLVEWRQRHK